VEYEVEEFFIYRYQVENPVMEVELQPPAGGPPPPAPQYRNVTTWAYDVALVKLKEPVKLDRYVNVVCLPAANEEFPTGTPCLTAGWGNRQVPGEYETVVVNHVSVPVFDWDACKRVYDATRPDMTITKDMICAGLQEGGKDSCQGDSGGPLVTYSVKEKRWILVGVVSWGYRCALPGYPGVYARVSYFIPWIEQTIADHTP